MDNFSNIKSLSTKLNLFFSLLLILVPLFYIAYWWFINDLSYPFISVNSQAKQLSPSELSIKLQILGFLASLFPLSAFFYGVLQLKKLFSFYEKGMIFSLEHVSIFKKLAKALTLWVVFSIIYESVKSVIFSINNPEGSRVLQVGIDSNQVILLIVSVIILLIAKIMDEGRKIDEESKFTI